MARNRHYNTFAAAALVLTGCSTLPKTPPTYTVTRGPVFQTYQDSEALVVYPTDLSLNCPPATAIVAGQIPYSASAADIYYRVILSDPSGGPRQAYEGPMGAGTSADTARRAAQDMASSMGFYLLAGRNPDCSLKVQQASWNATLRVEDRKGRRVFLSACRIDGQVAGRPEDGKPQAYASVTCNAPSVEHLRSSSHPSSRGDAPSSGIVVPPRPVAWSRLPIALALNCPLRRPVPEGPG